MSDEISETKGTKTRRSSLLYRDTNTSMTVSLQLRSTRLTQDSKIIHLHDITITKIESTSSCISMD